MPGGAIDRGETATEAALREAREEAGIAASSGRVVQTILGTDHGDWTYTYVLAEAPRPAESNLLPGGYWESDRTAWVDLVDVSAMALHPGLAADWPRLLLLLAARGEGE